MLKSLLRLGCVLSFVLAAVLPASAAELFGVHLFGEKKSAVKPGALSYTVDLNVESKNGDLKGILEQTSLLATQAKQGAADIFALTARARADREQLTAALYAEALFGSRVEILVDGKSLDAAVANAADRTPDQSVAVTIKVTAGPVFHFGDVAIGQTQPTKKSTAIEPETYNLIRGQPARSGIIVAALDQIVEGWRSRGYPLANVSSKDITADHDQHQVNIDVTVDPGPPAVYGWISVVGANELDSNTIADQSGLQPGTPFDPDDLRKSHERLRKFESIESVRIIEGDHVDASGGIPVTLDVSERKPRYIGGTASVSTLEGAEVNAYWGHRNLFGEGERLRVDGSVSRLGTEAFDGLEFDAGAVFEKPGIYDIDTAFFAEFRIARDNPEPYDAFSVRAKAGVSHKFSPTTTGSVALQVEQSRIEDAFGERDHTLFSAPTDLSYDGRDNRLDAQSGYHVAGGLNPVVDVAEGDAFVAAEGHGAAYRALDGDGRIVLAGRVAGGSIAGAQLLDTPASYRFFAGGGGSVRGYEFRSLGPLVDGALAGGLSYVSASAELRWRVSQQFGIVPFVDAALVSEQSLPKFSEAVYVGTGLGIRYYTSLGPLRFDLAVPVTERDNRDAFSFYVGLGQSF